MSSYEVMASSPPAPTFVPAGRLPNAAEVPATPTMLLNHALEAVVRLSKGFSHAKMTQHCPQVGAAPFVTGSALQLRKIPAPDCSSVPCHVLRASNVSPWQLAAQATGGNASARFMLR